MKLTLEPINFPKRRPSNNNLQCLGVGQTLFPCEKFHQNPSPEEANKNSDNVVELLKRTIKNLESENLKLKDHIKNAEKSIKNSVKHKNSLNQLSAKQESMQLKTQIGGKKM
jgi:hypothetical protein